MKTKKTILSIILVLLIVLMIVIFSGINTNRKNSEKKQIVVTNFATYDFVRQIIGDSIEINVDFLLDPGMDSHGYEPSAHDIIKINNADAFIYVGRRIRTVGR